VERWWIWRGRLSGTTSSGSSLRSRAWASRWLRWFVQVGLFRGLLANASVTIDRAEADLWVTARNAPNVDLASAFPKTYVQRVRSVPGVARADNLIVWVIRVTQPGGATEDAVIYALEDFSRWGLPWSVEEGDPADLRRGKFLMIDRAQGGLADSRPRRDRGPRRTLGVRENDLPDNPRVHADPLLGAAQHRWPRGRPEAARPAP
jgi:hypothetical protein